MAGSSSGLGAGGVSRVGRRLRGRLALVPMLVLCMLAASGCLMDWTEFGGGAADTHMTYDNGIQASTLASVVPYLTATTGGPIASSPAVANGVVYVTSDDGKLYAFDATAATGCSGLAVTCAPTWTASIQPAGAIGAAALLDPPSPAVDGGLVLVGTLSKQLDAFDAAGATNCSGSPRTCNPVWSATLAGAVYGSPSISNGVAYVGDTSGKLYAFDATGTTNCAGSPKVCSPLWTAVVSGYIANTPAVSNGSTYVATTGGKVYAFDAAGATNCSGSPKVCTPKWTATAGAAIGESSPTLADGSLFVGAVDSKVYAFNATTGAPTWSATTGGLINGSPAAYNGTVWIGSTDHKLYAFNDATGARQWTATTGGAINGSPVESAGYVYIGSGDGKVTAYSATGTKGCGGSPVTCTALWTTSTGGAVNGGPIIAQGTLWYGSADHKLYAQRPWTYTNLGTGCDTTDVNGGLNPCQLQREYQLPSAVAGAGHTVAIVDAYDNPSTEADLAVYRARWGLPACTTANGCFRKLNQSGAAGPYPPAQSSWGTEIALDVQAVSATCPNCHITLVEANSAAGDDLLAAEQTAISLHPTAVSNSWGGSEFSGENDYDSIFANAGMPITASTGDFGYGTTWPSSSPAVTAVGGTQLANPAIPRGWTEQAWGDAVGGAGGGSGCSLFEPKPAWQHDSGCADRAIADVSALAGYPGLLIYNSYDGSGWFALGGTSLASPIVAAVYALAGTTAPLATTYAATGTLNDITAGENGACGSYLCTAQAGYDGPTGQGTPCGTASFGTSLYNMTAAACATANGAPPAADGVAAAIAPSLHAPSTAIAVPVCEPATPGEFACAAYRIIQR